MGEHKYQVGDRLMVVRQSDCTSWRKIGDGKRGWWHRHRVGTEVTVIATVTTYSGIDGVVAYRTHHGQIVHEDDLTPLVVPPLTDEELTEVRHRLGIR